MKAIGYIVAVDESGSQLSEAVVHSKQTKVEVWCQANGYVLEAVRLEVATGYEVLINTIMGLTDGYALVFDSFASVPDMTAQVTAMIFYVGTINGCLASALDCVDTRTAGGRYVFASRVLMREYERELKAEKAAKGG